MLSFEKSQENFFLLHVFKQLQQVEKFFYGRALRSSYHFVFPPFHFGWYYILSLTQHFSWTKQLTFLEFHTKKFWKGQKRDTYASTGNFISIHKVLEGYKLMNRHMFHMTRHIHHHHILYPNNRAHSSHPLHHCNYCQFHHRKFQKPPDLYLHQNHRNPNY